MYVVIVRAAGSDKEAVYLVNGEDPRQAFENANTKLPISIARPGQSITLRYIDGSYVHEPAISTMSRVD
jgi:hypothetical protein